MTGSLAKAAIAATLALVGAMPAAAAPLTFSYRFIDGNTLSGMVDGTLEADGNRFAIDHVDSLAVNGTAIDANDSIMSYDGYKAFTQGLPGNSMPYLSLDGSFLDLVLSHSVPPANPTAQPSTQIDVTFQVGTPYAVAVAALYPQYSDGVLAALPSFGGSGPGPEAFVRANYSAAVEAGVPEPATWAMTVLGIGMVGFGLRRRAGKTTTRVAFA